MANVSPGALVAASNPWIAIPKFSGIESAVSVDSEPLDWVSD